MTNSVEQARHLIDPAAVKYLENVPYYAPDYVFDKLRDELGTLWAFLAELEGKPHSEHLPTKAVALIYSYSIVLHHKPFAIVKHQPTNSLAEKSAILLEQHAEIARQLGRVPQDILPLKTLTVKVIDQGRPHYFLVSGLGDFRIERQVQKELLPAFQQILGTKTNVFNRGTWVNPSDFNPCFKLGVDPGIVSPFIDLARWDLGRNLRGLVYYGDLQIAHPVAIAVSTTDSLIIEGGVFPLALNVWQGFYLNLPFKAVPLGASAQKGAA